MAATFDNHADEVQGELGSAGSRIFGPRIFG